MTKDKKKKQGSQKKYTAKLAIALTADLAYMDTKEACKKHGISERTYYRWLHSEEGLCQLSVRARATKATYHYNKATEILETTSEDPAAINLARFKFDGHLRLAGKANQGLFGDRPQINQINNTQNHFFGEMADELEEATKDLIDVTPKVNKKSLLEEIV